MTARRSKPSPRRRRRWSYAAIALVLVAIWVGWSPSFRVQTVEVRGTSSLSPEAVRAAADIPPGTHLWFGVDPQGLAQRVLDSLPMIDEAAVNRGFPGRVVIAVLESQPVAQVLTSGGAYHISSRGIVLSVGTGLSLPLLVLNLHLPSLSAGQALPAHARGPLAVAVAVQRLELEGISKIERAPDGTLWLTTDEGTAVRVGLVDDGLEERLAPLPYLLEDARQSGYLVEYVDVSCPGRPVLKTRSEDDDE